jgi:small subunit ribosomal protein S17
MERGRRKTIKGIVVGNKMQNTVVVRVDTTCRHPVYNKVVKRSQKLYAHDATNELQPGAEVTVVETRPISKLKRWRVVG